jgi:hypothetical protein
MVFDAVGGFLELSLAAQSEYAILEFQIEVLLFHAWKLRPDQVRVSAFQYIDRRKPYSGAIGGRMCSRTAEGFVEKIINAGLDPVETFERFPFYQVHNYPPFGKFFFMAKN